MTGTDHFTNLSSDASEQLQLERLQSTLTRAYRQVSFHRHRFDELGIRPADIENISDISRLPFLHRADFSEHYPYDLFAVPLRDIVRIHTAPGTTRNPTVSGYTPHDLSMWRQMTARAMHAAGINSHDILQVSLNPGLANWGRDYKDSAESMGVSVIPNTRLSVDKQFMVLRDYKTTVLTATPALAAQLADYMSHADISPAELALHTVILVGETASDAFRHSIQKALNVSTWLHYGLSEVPGPAIAFECDAHNGLHIHEDHFLPEIIHPETGEPLPIGQTGELVLTTLTTRAFPLIRFRTGDRAKIIEKPCTCGRTLARIEWFAERTDDIINLDGVNVHRNQVCSTINRTLSLPADDIGLRVAVKEGNKILEVMLPMSDQIFSDEIKELEKLLRRTENQLWENLGVPVAIRLLEAKR